MLIDDITITIRAGDGGKGAVSFNKNLNQYGPVGGSGGAGGSIYFIGSSDLGVLRSYRYKKVFAAQNGKDGQGQFRDGNDAKDLVLSVPVGTVIENLTTGVNCEVITIGEPLLAARGGIGGRGNFHFRSSRNTRPKEFEYGKPGQHFSVRLSLKLIADIGLIGLPNAGKTSLLNELSRAGGKVGNYEFTTLEPNLGTFFELILADIPGLIEGASSGKGLGIKFLRHIERTNTLFHLISAESEDPVRDYKIVRKELGAYAASLLEKKEYILLSKSDTADAAAVKRKVAALKKQNSSIVAFSIHDFESIERIKKELQKLVKKKRVAGQDRRPRGEALANMKIFVKAKPGAKRERVERVDAAHFAVSVRAHAREGKANPVIKKALAAYFKAPVTKVHIVHGHTSREKVIEL